VLHVVGTFMVDLEIHGKLCKCTALFFFFPPAWAIQRLHPALAITAWKSHAGDIRQRRAPICLSYPIQYSIRYSWFKVSASAGDITGRVFFDDHKYIA
jgi:hypothetical protein